MGSERAEVFEAKHQQLNVARETMQALSALPIDLERMGYKINQDGVRRSAHDLMRYPEIDFSVLEKIWPELGQIRPDIAEQVEIDAKYAGYIQRQQADINAFRRDEALLLPHDLDYKTVGSLSNEMCLKLSKFRPETLGAAARIPGVTPAALVALLRHVKRKPKADKQVA